MDTHNQGIFKNPKTNWILTIVVLIGFFLFSSSVFVLREGEQASAFAFGKPRRDYTTPGLKLKAPWPFETLSFVDKRLLLYSGKEMILQEKTKKKLLIDWFCLYRIDNPKTYFTKVVSLANAERRIDDNVSSDIAAILGENVFEDIVTNQRQNFLGLIQRASNRGLDDIDLSIKFLSFNRVELPDENKAAVFRDMISDRQKISNGYLAEGHKIKDSIQSAADFQVAEIISAAERESAIIKGAADSTRLAIMNKAYTKSKELFRIYNEIETFKKSYSKNTEWILTPETMIPHK